MDIRLARPDDFAAIRDISNWAILNTAIHFGYEPDTLEYWQHRWESTRDKYPWLTADDAGQVVGFAYAGAFRTRAAYDWSAETSVYVRPDRHRQGIGRALYGRLIPLLRAQGFRCLIGGITLPNAASVGLHEAMGFAPVGVFRHVGWKFNRWHDVGFWQLDFPENEGVRPIERVAMTAAKVGIP